VSGPSSWTFSPEPFPDLHPRLPEPFVFFLFSLRNAIPWLAFGSLAWPPRACEATAISRAVVTRAIRPERLAVLQVFWRSVRA